MREFCLMPHPDRPPVTVAAVRVGVERRGTGLHLTFRVEGEGLVLPDRVAPARADGLWTATCCEMFLAAAESPSYYEFNYSPSTRWAAYRFDAYRAGGRDLALSIVPHIVRGNRDAGYLVEVEQDLTDISSGPLRMGLSAVIEETDGTKSYWALAHAPGPPDFHNTACWTARLFG